MKSAPAARPAPRRPGDPTPTIDRQAASSPTAESRSRAKWAFAGFLALAAFLLVAEHRAHLLGFLPWLLLIACPLLHLFMHRGHGRPSSAGKDPAPGDET